MAAIGAAALGAVPRAALTLSEKNGGGGEGSRDGPGMARCRFWGGRVGLRAAGEGWVRRGMGTGRVVMAAAAGAVGRMEMMAEAEARWQSVVDRPMEGVGFTDEEFADALGKYEVNLEVGAAVRGVVFRADFNGALVDIGAKAAAFLPVAEASMHRLKDVREVGLEPGAEEDFAVVQEDDNNGRVIISLRKLHYDLSWDRCRQLHADDVPIRGRVVSANRGGLLVLVEGLRGFVPFSQVCTGSEQSDMVDREIPLKFMEVDEEKTRLVLSNRKAMAAAQAGLAIGSVVTGTVQAVMPYGAFIDFGGSSGLLHISQISHDRVTNVENVLQPGDKLKVMVLSHDKDRGRISLSTKKLEPSPGDMLRNPALVYDAAEDMALAFRQKVARAEEAARADEFLMQRDGQFSLRSLTGPALDALGLKGIDLEDVPVAV